MYLNPGSRSFRMAVGSEIYVDKTEMIRHLNAIVDTSQRYVSVSRPRRFGKTMAADMLCAYYSRDTDARKLFEDMKLAKSSHPNDNSLPWDVYLGKFDVVRLTMSEFLEDGVSIRDSIKRMQQLVSREIRNSHPNIDSLSEGGLSMDMQAVYSSDGTRFAVIIDEWDAPMRERKDDEVGQRTYLDFLRNWLKDKDWLALAYITGILPIKKYGIHSALNMFDEYSMVSPKRLAEFTGFTAQEVRDICDQRRLRYDAMCEWYDGYVLTDAPSPDLVLDPVTDLESKRLKVFNPLSVVSAARYRRLESYWSHTETYEALEEYIRMDFDGLRESVALLMDGGHVSANLGTYQNDMSTFRSRDDVFALLVHLGYLGWDADTSEVFIPNREILQVFRDSTRIT
jgi:hypothetical protein